MSKKIEKGSAEKDMRIALALADRAVTALALGTGTIQERLQDALRWLIEDPVDHERTQDRVPPEVKEEFRDVFMTSPESARTFDEDRAHDVAARVLNLDSELWRIREQQIREYERGRRRPGYQPTSAAGLEREVERLLVTYGLGGTTAARHLGAPRDDDEGESA